MKKVLILFSLLFTSCGDCFTQNIPYQQTLFPNFNKIPVYIFRDKKISEKVVDAAITIWNLQTSINLFEKSNLASEADIFLKVSDFPKDFQEFDGLATKNTDEQKCLVELKEGFSISSSLLAHELGHCLGFAHVKNVDSLMNPTVYSSKVTCELKIDLFDYLEGL